MPWVRSCRITKAGHVHCVIEEVDAAELPDGVGFPTRAACKAFYRRKDNAKPIWLEDELSGPRPDGEPESEDEP